MSMFSDPQDVASKPPNYREVFQLDTIRLAWVAMPACRDLGGRVSRCDALEVGITFFESSSTDLQGDASKGPSIEWCISFPQAIVFCSLCADRGSAMLLPCGLKKTRT